MADVARDERIRSLRIWARSETGKEPVVSITVALGLVNGWGEEVRLERRIDARRWSESCVFTSVLKENEWDGRRLKKKNVIQGKMRVK